MASNLLQDLPAKHLSILVDTHPIQVAQEEVVHTGPGVGTVHPQVHIQHLGIHPPVEAAADYPNTRPAARVVDLDHTTLEVEHHIHMSPTVREVAVRTARIVVCTAQAHHRCNIDSEAARSGRRIAVVVVEAAKNACSHLHVHSRRS